MLVTIPIIKAGGLNFNGSNKWAKQRMGNAVFASFYVVWYRLNGPRRFVSAFSPYLTGKKHRQCFVNYILWEVVPFKRYPSIYFNIFSLFDVKKPFKNEK